MCLSPNIANTYYRSHLIPCALFPAWLWQCGFSLHTSAYWRKARKIFTLKKTTPLQTSGEGSNWASKRVITKGYFVLFSSPPLLKLMSRKTFNKSIKLAFLCLIVCLFDFPRRGLSSLESFAADWTAQWDPSFTSNKCLHIPFTAWHSAEAYFKQPRCWAIWTSIKVSWPVPLKDKQWSGDLHH